MRRLLPLYDGAIFLNKCVTASVDECVDGWFARAHSRLSRHTPRKISSSFNRVMDCTVHTPEFTEQI